MQSVRGMLENPSEAVSDLSYFDCIDGVMENSKVELLFLPVIVPQHVSLPVSKICLSLSKHETLSFICYWLYNGTDVL